MRPRCRSVFRSSARHSWARWLLPPAALAVAVVPGFAGTFTAFGPETYQRGTGKPVTVVKSFSVLNPATDYLIRVRNGADGQFAKVSSAVISINGVQVLGPNDFNQTVTVKEKPVTLRSSNDIAVELRSQPGSGLAIEVIGIDNDPPTVTATAAPGPNVAGWNNSDVTVSFSCSDATSGVASCPSPITVSVEGANQAITGTATDRAGNSATATVTLSIDKTPPSVTAASSPAPNEHGWNNTDVTVAFECTDGLSGVASCPAPVVASQDGANQVITGTAIDSAGNSAWTSVTLSIDKTPPSLTAVSSPAPNEHGWNNTDVTVAFTCTDALSGVASCPPAVTLTAEGGNQTVPGTATDLAGNSAATSVTLSIDKTPPLVTAESSPAPNAAGWNNTDVRVSFEAQDALSGVGSVSPPVEIGTEGSQAVGGSATDMAGNLGLATAVVNVDKTVPRVVLSAPEDGAVRRVGRVEVRGTASDDNALASVAVNGIDAGLGGEFTVEVPLAEEGPHTLTAVATDVAGNLGSASVGVVYSAPPVVEITSPRDLEPLGTSPVVVTGTVDDPQATVTVNGVAIGTPASGGGGTFTALVPLREGGNVLTAVAVDAQGNAGTDSITVLLDTAPPRIAIDSPASGSVVTVSSITVTGRINDVTMGTVNREQGRVVVNGVAAVVSNRTFMATGVELGPGVNTITAVGTDSVGNSDSARITVMRETAAGLRIEVVSGDQQAAGIGEALAPALVVAVRDQAGQGVAGRTVIFRVTQNSGTLLDAEGRALRALIATTDAEGRAQARFQLGSRSGVGNNRVEATSPGIPGAAVFVATGTSHGPAKINVDSGNNQKGVVRQALPRPFVAVVTDQGHNRLKGVQVTFAVVAGGGDFSGQESTTVTTDSDGRALAVLALGVTPGIENNVVTAAVANLLGLPAAFTASGYEPGDPAQTRISGVVLDNTNLPVPRVTLRVRQTALSAQTDAEGQFVIQGAPVGEVHLFVDGSTAERPGTWPDLEYEMVTVPGANNTLGMPIYLLPLDLANGIFVDETHGGTLTLPDYPGFSLTVAPNSARFPDGTRRGTISVTPVHMDKVPMVPNFGQQPRFIVTIQPPGVRFEPPAQVTHPNVDGLAPGEITEIYSFDHDMGSFVATGTATVSEDGLVLRSDPGTGILKGGWHCGGNPTTAGTAADCPPCETCDGEKCVTDPQADPKKCCDGKPFDSKKECCESKKILPKGPPIADLADCPNRAPSDPPVPPITNGCTGVPNNPSALSCSATCAGAATDFTPACDQHDRNYDTCGMRKDDSDAAFCMHLDLICRNLIDTNPACAECCDMYARRYCLVVADTPAKYFYEPAQKRVCQCCK